MNNKTIILASLCATPGFSPAANVADSNIADSSRVYDIDEVIVASHPKDWQRLRQQPISSTSLSAKSMDDFAMHDLRDAATYIPSFVMPDYGSRYTSAVYVRGIGSRVNSPAVGIYVDNVPLTSKSSFNTHLYNMSRIDVLRGPQGTLYGQNTEGGLVRIYTKNPLVYQGTDVKFGMGRFLERSAEISHYDKVEGVGAYSISAFYNGQNGFLRNATTGERADRSNEAGARLKFMRQQTDRLLIGVTADWQWVKQNGFAYGEYDLQTRHISSPSTNLQNNYMRHLASVGLNVGYTGCSMDVNSTTSYQYLNDKMQMDQDYMPVNCLTLHQKQLMNAITEELSFRNKNADNWHWVNGIFFSYQWLKTDAPVGFGNGITTPIGNAIASSIYNGILNGMTAKGMPENVAKDIIDKAGGVKTDVTMTAPGSFKTPQLNAAIYHESTFDVTHRLCATLGMRYDLSHASIDYDTYAGMYMNVNIMGAAATRSVVSRLHNKERNTFNQLLPKIGITYKLGDTGRASSTGKFGNIYASVSKGYRTGGYNIQMFSDILQSELMRHRTEAMKGDYEVEHTTADYDKVRQTIEYKPETSWNYEIGTHLNLFNSSVHLDLCAYLMNIKDQQLSVMAGTYGFGRMMVNAGRSRSMGCEAALRGSSFDNALAWTVAYGYTSATFRNYTSGDANYRGNYVPYIPRHTVSATADYTAMLRATALKSVSFGMGLTAQGPIYWDEANTYSQPFYTLLNAHCMLQFKSFRVNVWAKNITGTQYCTFAMDSQASGRKLYFGQKGTPFTFGAEIAFHI